MELLTIKKCFAKGGEISITENNDKTLIGQTVEIMAIKGKIKCEIAHQFAELCR